jgi:hypothetical protein
MSPYWLVWVLGAIFGAAMVARWRAGRPPRRKASRTRDPGPLRPGESYDTSVKLATVPNAPLADLWCQRLREEGIEAYTKSGPGSALAGIYGGTVANPGYPTEVWVGEHDADRAQELFPELV